MRVAEVEVHRLELELVHPVATSRGAHDRRPVVVVRVVTDVGAGWGECPALEAPSYTSEYADGAERVLIDHLVPILLAGPDYCDTAAAMAALGAVRGHPMAKAALELALLDAELRAVGRSLADFLGATRSSVRAGATVGIGGTDAVVAGVVDAVAAGFTRVKCKIAPGHDLGPLRAVRRAFPGLGLSVDANGAYALDEPDHAAVLRHLDELDLVAIEQPLAPDALGDLAELSARLTTPVLLDESVETARDLEAVLAARAGDAVALKPARVGGVAAARRFHDRCVGAGLGVSVGGLFETGIGRAAALAVAALPGVDLPGDLGPSDRYYAPDLTAPHVMSGGELAVPDGPGLGVEVRAEVVAGATVRTTALGRG